MIYLRHLEPGGLKNYQDYSSPGEFRNCARMSHISEDPHQILDIQRLGDATTCFSAFTISSPPSHCCVGDACNTTFTAVWVSGICHTGDQDSLTGCLTDDTVRVKTGGCVVLEQGARESIALSLESLRHVNKNGIRSFSWEETKSPGL